MTTKDQEVLARNDRYVRDFVEALHLCPYARQCRVSDKLHRRVVRRREDALAAIREVEALPVDSVEVALLDCGVAVRDSKDPDGPVLRFGDEAWQGFVDSVRAGAFE